MILLHYLLLIQIRILHGKENIFLEVHFFNVLLLESGSLKDEMFKLFGYKLDTPTASSFVQARSKIRPDAFRTLFNMFNERTQKIKLHKGYRLLAVDGSVLPISSAIKDIKPLFIRPIIRINLSLPII